MGTFLAVVFFACSLGMVLVGLGYLLYFLRVMFYEAWIDSKGWSDSVGGFFAGALLAMFFTSITMFYLAIVISFIKPFI